jgi:SOS response regulatory protein OraA/RecX
MPYSRKTTRPNRPSARDPQAFVWSSLAAKAQSVAEIEAKLGARGVDPVEAAATIAEAVELGFLDDTELAGQLARGFHTRGYGRRRAAQALGRRGLPPPLVLRALDDVYGGVDESDLARRALGRRGVERDRDRRRAVAFLLRRGFSPSAAWAAVRSPRPP